VVRGYSGFGFLLLSITALSLVFEPRAIIPSIFILKVAASVAFAAVNPERFRCWVLRLLMALAGLTVYSHQERCIRQRYAPGPWLSRGHRGSCRWHLGTATDA
jgi:hypothetical protein